MEQLKVIGTEDDALLVATESGERFSLAVDDVLRIELRKRTEQRDGEPELVSRARSRRTSAPDCRPKRSRRCSAPASRTSRASRDRCSPSASTSWPGARRSRAARQRSRRRRRPTFGGVDARSSPRPAPPANAGRAGRRGARLDRQARVHRDDRPRRAVELRAPQQSLSPLNADAITLSRQGSLPGGLIPRLRALEPDARRLPLRQRRLHFRGAEQSGSDRAPHLEPSPTHALRRRRAPAVAQAAIKRADEPASHSARPPTCSRRSVAVAANVRPRGAKPS